MLGLFMIIVLVVLIVWSILLIWLRIPIISMLFSMRLVLIVAIAVRFFGEVLSRRLRELAERKRFSDEFELFNEFSRVLHMLQQVVDDVDTAFVAVSQELYRIYKECDGAEIRERIEVLMNRLGKIIGEAVSRSQQIGS